MIRTKIIATLGPASETQGVLRRMIRAGLDVARLNFSHGSFEEHSRRIALVRRLNKSMRRHIRILGDLEGHRIRLGRFKDARPIELTRGEDFWLLQRDILGEGRAVSFDYFGSLSCVKAGYFIYIDDGQIALEVKAISKGAIKTKVIAGGLLKERKGVNIPQADLSFEGLSSADQRAIAFMKDQGFDYAAQSFVQNAQDMGLVRKAFGRGLSQCRLIAKIENRRGIKNLRRILAVCDGVMVARGDLGVSIPVYQVPVVTKQIIRACKRVKKFVITATQMLESMVDHRSPTRAEVSDVANAVLDGSDFVMLSAETAVGDHPAGAVWMMNQVIRFTQESGTKDLF